MNRNKVEWVCNDPECVNKIWVEQGRSGGIWATHNKCLSSDGEPKEMRFCEPDPTQIQELILDLKKLYLSLLEES